jgi:hypothetical protein
MVSERWPPALALVMPNRFRCVGSQWRDERVHRSMHAIQLFSPMHARTRDLANQHGFRIAKCAMKSTHHEEVYESVILKA